MNSSSVRLHKFEKVLIDYANAVDNSRLSNRRSRIGTVCEWCAVDCGGRTRRVRKIESNVLSGEWVVSHCDDRCGTERRSSAQRSRIKRMTNPSWIQDLHILDRCRREIMSYYLLYIRISGEFSIISSGKVSRKFSLSTRNTYIYIYTYIFKFDTFTINLHRVQNKL